MMDGQRAPARRRRPPSRVAERRQVGAAQRARPLLGAVEVDVELVAREHREKGAQRTHAALGVGAVGRPLERQRRPLGAVAHRRVPFIVASDKAVQRKLARGELAEADQAARAAPRWRGLGVRQLDAEVALAFRGG